MDESLIFNLLVAKENYRATWKRVDPKTETAAFKLLKTPTDVPERQQISGTVVDSDGNPIRGAIVYIRGAKKEGRTWFGQIQNVDRVSVTADDGKFYLTSEEPFDEWVLQARSRGYCQETTESLPTGFEPQTIIFKRGVTVTGRVLSEMGEPVAGHIVGMFPKQRSGMSVLSSPGEQTVATDKEGVFTLPAVTPGLEWSIYSAIEDQKEVNFFQSSFFESGANESIKDLGDFQLRGNCRIKGRLVLPDSVELPAESRISVSRKHAWKHQNGKLDLQTGEFSFPALPRGETLLIQITVDGWEIDQSKQKYQIVRPYIGSSANLVIFTDSRSLDIDVPMTPSSK